MHKMKALAIMLIALTMLLVTACSGSGGGTTSADPPKAEEKVEAKTEALDAKDQEKDKPEEQAKKELPAFDMGGEPVKFMTWGGPPEEGKTNQEDVPSLAQQGYLRPVDDLINLDDPKWPKKIKEFSSFGGKIYGLVENVGAGAGLYYNRTLLKREGLEAPHELIKKGEWTWDKYLEMAKKATKDLNGDGAIDQWGIVSYAPVHARQLVYSNNGNIVEDKDGKLNFGLGDPNSMEALRFLYDLHNTHKVVMPNKNGNFEDYNETQKMFHSGKALFVTGEIWEGSGREEMTDEFGFVYFPKGPKANDYANPITNFTMWFMPVNVKKAKEKAQIFEDMVPWDSLEQFRQEEVEYSVQSPEDVEVALDLPNKIIPLYYDGIGDIGVKYNEAILSFVRGKDTPESAIEKIKKASARSVERTGLVG
ncbi:ABC transporter substrate-binding protein [Paenibacillus sp. OSY-SE]|uniref:ABC transporter substrate-binding protein n=1 Tax=Paenibacillus sp. OSY-SE TaxID=1196323 RepID=UPI0002F9A783|nr:extracellular solute-binding protein [Paenibacillus sp. OSY-SE]